MSGDPVNRTGLLIRTTIITVNQSLNHSRMYPELQARIEQHEATRFINQSIIAALLFGIIAIGVMIGLSI